MGKLLTERRGGVTLLTLNRPEVHNNVDRDLAVELAEAITAFEHDDEAKVLVITGAGDTTFCAGANLKGMNELWEHPHTDSAGPMGFARLDPGKPTIAAINGWCLAGGVELACWCDFRIVAENAKIGLLNKRWGLSLADGGTQRLPRIVGMGNALWMIETGIEIDAHRAQLIGLAQEVVPEGEALDRAMELAEHICTYPQVGIRADREAALGTVGLSLQDGLQLEVEICHPPVRHPDVTAGMATFVAGARPEPPRPRDAARP
ncbi:MAG: enoyl-CoA hydratase/isomerase family protein [Solirubrobacterales bacterium]|nr:enoyl-CoA hydratase/isomerase family protein [Solirubrobacterales bacterium]